MLGHVDEEDDTEIDSDEAFGESDEERFQGWTFRGSTSNAAREKEVKRKRSKVDLEDTVGNGEISLDEGRGNGEDEEEDDGLGDDAIDLATALDQYSASEEDSSDEGSLRQRMSNHHSESEDEDGSANQNSEFEEDDEDVGEVDQTSQFSISDDDEQNDLEKLARVQDLVNTLHPPESSTASKPKHIDRHEARAPSATGVFGSKFDINDLLAMPTTDSQSKDALKSLKAAQKASKKTKALQPSLPKRQKDKLDRIAANTKAKETLGRWVDTVKHNRRAEHLTFPLQDPEASSAQGTDRLLPTASRAPFNDLEDAIQKIMQESGLASGKADAEEEQFRAFEELQANKMSVEEVQARRAELRKARELMFREEVRAKRIKKIKSKAYRRVHRKERERLAALERDAFADGGSDIDEEERKLRDKRRAEERMGTKHRDSKWAKQMKKSGRSVWDEDARSGITEMARRNEELRRRIEGKTIHGEDDDGDAFTSSDEDDGFQGLSSGDDDTEAKILQRQLDRITGTDSNSEVGSKLSSLKFMQRAEAARKARNDDDVERMQRELAGEEISEKSEDETIGRKLFGPTQKAIATPKDMEMRNEFEERSEHESEDESQSFEVNKLDERSGPVLAKENSSTTKSKAKKSKNLLVDSSADLSITNGKHSTSSNGSGSKRNKDTATVKSTVLPQEIHSQPDADGWITVSYNHEEDDEAGDDGEEISQAEIIRRAFAGDDVEAEFEVEKKATIAEEDDKIIDNTLPGWGNWVGEGISKREQKRHKGRFLTKQEGIKPQDRKDAKLKHVIINQRRLKKNVAYLATTLPFPFTNRAEYERSIRMPIGLEWNVKETHLSNTKPRVLVKPGRIIAPMEKPMV
jgi:U3 small nucleolar RNA-associated protein 14